VSKKTSEIKRAVGDNFVGDKAMTTVVKVVSTVTMHVRLKENGEYVVQSTDRQSRVECENSPVGKKVMDAVHAVFKKKGK
jgi:hypothetical protein